MRERDLWWRQAACRDLPLQWFYPKSKRNSFKDARAVCSKCPVVSQCFNDMLKYEDPDDRSGFWGNTSPDDRDGKEPPPPKLCVHGKPLIGGFCESCYEGRIAAFANRGECSHGHRLTLDNIVPSAEGRPQCRQCRKDRAREFRERKKAC